MKLTRKTFPASRPLRMQSASEVHGRFMKALKAQNGLAGAHCIHELWMRGAMAINIESMLKELWACCGDSVPEWLPMRHIECLSLLYTTTVQFKASGKGKANIYLVLLDYSDRADPYGVYVGMTQYTPAQRFDQHKAGIRAAGSVLKRGVEVLTGPTLHLQKIQRADAELIEVELAEALTAVGLFVQGGH